VLERRDYPPAVRRLLGEAMVATALLSASIKFQGLLTLQLQSNQGPLRLLVVQCGGEGNLRGLARWRGEVGEAPLFTLCAEGTLVITIDPGFGKDRYQGIVSLTGDSLAAALEEYFAYSEQLPTRLRLLANERTAAGLLLQRLPGETLEADAWKRIEALGATLTDQELLNLDAQEIVHRLFHQEDVRLFEAQPMSFRCTCSRERIESMLLSLGYAEVKSVLQEQGRVSVTCEFCGMCYGFDAVDVEGLFAAAMRSGISTARH
jgi:molecular chaperone Hsp33